MKKCIGWIALVLSLALFTACPDGSETIIPGPGDPVTVTNLNLSSIIGVPAKDGNPVFSYNGDQYSLAITWEDDYGDTLAAGELFGGGLEYTARAVITVKEGWTLDELHSGSFTHSGAESVILWGSTITLVFEATEADDFDISRMFSAPANRTLPVREFEGPNFDGEITWFYDTNPEQVITGASIFYTEEPIKAVVTLTAHTAGFFEGITADNFTYRNSTGITGTGDDSVMNLTITFAALPEPDLVSSWLQRDQVGSNLTIWVDYREYRFYDDGTYVFYDIHKDVIAEEGTYTLDGDHDELDSAFLMTAHWLGSRSFDITPGNNPLEIPANPTTTGDIVPGEGRISLQVFRNWKIGDGIALHINTYPFPPSAANLNLTQAIPQPVRDAARTTSTTNNQFNTTIAWEDADGNVASGNAFRFLPDMVYTATVTINIGDGWTLTGANPVHAQATTVELDAQAGTVTLVFPPTAGPDLVTLTNLTNLITTPIKYYPPEFSASNAQYSMVIAWETDAGVPLTEGSDFDADTVYIAKAELTPINTNFTLDGLEEDSFTHDDADFVVYDPDTYTVTLTFPATTLGDDPITDRVLDSIIPNPLDRGVPVTVYNGSQYSLAISWSDGTTAVNDNFAAGTAYTATAEVSPGSGWTLEGLNETSFTHADAESVTLDVATSTITVVFDTTPNPTVVTNRNFTPQQALPHFVVRPRLRSAPITTGNTTTWTGAVQYTGEIAWFYEGTPDVPITDTFDKYEPVIKAVLTLTASPGYTFSGIAANWFQNTDPTWGNPSLITNPVGTGPTMTVTVRYAPLGQFGNPAAPANIGGITHVLQYFDDGTYTIRAAPAGVFGEVLDEGTFTVGSQNNPVFTMDGGIATTGTLNQDNTNGRFTLDANTDLTDAEIPTGNTYGRSRHLIPVP